MIDTDRLLTWIADHPDADLPALAAAVRADKLTSTTADLDRDPVVSEWARRRVRHLITRLAQFETEAHRAGDTRDAMRWRGIGNLVRVEVLGDPRAATLGVFDERLVLANASLTTKPRRGRKPVAAGASA